MIAAVMHGHVAGRALRLAARWAAILTTLAAASLSAALVATAPAAAAAAPSARAEKAGAPAARATAPEPAALVEVVVEPGAVTESVRYRLSGPPGRLSVLPSDAGTLALEISNARSRVSEIPRPEGLRLLRALRVEQTSEGGGPAVLTTLRIAPGTSHRIEVEPDGFRLILIGEEPSGLAIAVEPGSPSQPDGQTPPRQAVPNSPPLPGPLAVHAVLPGVPANPAKAPLPDAAPPAAQAAPSPAPGPALAAPSGPASEPAMPAAEPGAPPAGAEMPPGAPIPSGATIAPAPSLPSPARVEKPAGGDYVIGKQDLLQISVFQLDSLNQTVRVQDDGSITLPLVGEIQADGMARRDLQNAIAGRLSPRYLLDPQVSVFVKEFQSKKVAVIGAVKKPGSYELIGTRTLLEVVSLAEGILKEQAARTIQVIRRESDGSTRSISIDFALLEAGDPAANIPLQGGDIVNVPVDDVLLIYVHGAVRKPDVFKVKRSEPVTVLKVVTMAGGVNERGSERRVQVIRQRADGTSQVIPVDLKRIKKGKDADIVLEKNDVVVVPEAYF